MIIHIVNLEITLSVRNPHNVGAPSIDKGKRFFCVKNESSGIIVKLFFQHNINMSLNFLNVDFIRNKVWFQ